MLVEVMTDRVLPRLLDCKVEEISRAAIFGAGNSVLQSRNIRPASPWLYETWC